jgi:flagellar motor switch protein FliM
VLAGGVAIMAEILSQDEIDALLRGISTGEVSAEDVKEEKGQKVKVYDFRRPEKFSRDQIRTLEMMHETFARHISTTLTAHLRSGVNMRVASVDQITYDEFIKSLPVPSTLATVDMNPLPGRFLIEIDPELTFVMIDRLFGGQGDPIKTQRELSEIEDAVVEGIILQMLNNLRDTWSSVMEVKPKLVGIESNPQFAFIVPPTDIVALITFEAKINNVEGIMNICIPYAVIEPISSKLSSQFWFTSIRKGTTVSNISVIRKRVMSIKVPVVVEIGRTRIGVRDMLQLQRGDVIRLNTKVKDPLTVRVGSRPKFTCHPGTRGSRIAVQVDQVLSEEEGGEEDERWDAFAR